MRKPQRGEECNQNNVQRKRKTFDGPQRQSFGDGKRHREKPEIGHGLNTQLVHV